MFKIKASAPGKLMLFGEHAVVYGHPCIVTSIDANINVEIEEAQSLKIEAPGVKNLNFVNETLKLFCEKFKVRNNLLIKTSSDETMEYGLGSSSAVTVALIKALSQFYKINISKKEIFNLGYKSVLNVQGVGSGFDIASSVFGGTIYFVTAGKVIEPLSVKNIPLVIGYSGTKADTSSIVKNLEFRIHNSELEHRKIFENIKQIVDRAKISLLNSDWEKTGDLMSQNHILLQELGVSTEKLDKMCGAAVASGAYGAKLSGAGGGDCMIALIPPDKIKDVESSIIKTGGEIIKIRNNI